MMVMMMIIIIMTMIMILTMMVMLRKIIKMVVNLRMRMIHYHVDWNVNLYAPPNVPYWNMFLKMNSWKMRVDTVTRYLHVLRPFVWQDLGWLVILSISDLISFDPVFIFQDGIFFVIEILISHLFGFTFLYARAAYNPKHLMLSNLRGVGSKESGGEPPPHLTTVA